jgi:hypothetical protein
VFDARFVGDDISVDLGQGLIKDYRQGSVTTTGARVHEIKYQVGSGSNIVISWNLPDGVTGRLQDVIIGSLVDQAMNGSGSCTVTNPEALSKLTMTITYAIPVGIATDGVRASYELRQNYPNPFNPRTIIEYSVSKTTIVLLRVFNRLGQVVTTLTEGKRDPGIYRVEWNPGLPSGVYFCRFETPDFVETKAMLLLK